MKTIIIIILVLAIVSFINLVLLSYWREYLRILRLCNDIQIGNTYRYIEYSNNPFDEDMIYDVIIIDIKDDWVKYRYSDGEVSIRSKYAFIKHSFRKIEK